MTQANKKQIELLTNFMQEHTNLAKSFSGKGINYKESHKILWEKLSTTLNANGPPTKTTAEWKRIWTTRKYSAKKKLMENKKSIQQTGGGPFMELPLDATEEAIVQACGIEAAIVGINGVSSFGCGEESETIQNIDEVEMPIEPVTSQALSQVRVGSTVNPHKKTQKKEPLVEESIVLTKKIIELQEKFLNMQSSLQGSLESIDCSIKEMNDSLKTLCNIKQKDSQATISLKNEEIRLKRVELELARAMNELRVVQLQN